MTLEKLKKFKESADLIIKYKNCRHISCDICPFKHIDCWNEVEKTKVWLRKYPFLKAELIENSQDEIKGMLKI